MRATLFTQCTTLFVHGTRARRNGRRSLLAALIAAALAAPCGLSSPIAADQTSGAWAMDWGTDILRHLRRVGSILEGVMMATPAASMQDAALDEKLDAALAEIDTILDTDVYPSLDPGDAGSIDLSFDPQVFEEYYEDTLFLIDEAIAEVETAPSAFDADLVGTNLKTIEHLINRETPHNYRNVGQ